MLVKMKACHRKFSRVAKLLAFQIESQGFAICGQFLALSEQLQNLNATGAAVVR